MYHEECIKVKFSEGLGIFDQHYGYPQIDEQEIYDGPTGKVIDIQGIQAHAGKNFFVPEGKEFSSNIDQCPYLQIAIKAEPGTNTCLFLLVHERKHDWNRRFVVIGKTPQGDCRRHLMSNYFTILDDNKWHEYVYDLRTIREEKDDNVYHQRLCQDAGSIREIQFYTWTGSGTHAFQYGSLRIYSDGGKANAEVKSIYKLDDLAIKRIHLDAVSYQLKDPRILESKVRLADPTVDAEEYVRKVNDYRKRLEMEIKEKTKALNGKYISFPRSHFPYLGRYARFYARRAAYFADEVTSEPNFLLGYVTPHKAYYSVGHGKKIHHNSTYKYYCYYDINCYCHYYEHFSYPPFRTWVVLHDDDAWWRRDNPDMFDVAHVYEWELPEAPWDANVDVSIFVRPEVYFRNAANKYGRIMAFLIFGHSDDHGKILGYSIHVGDLYYENEWGFSKQILSTSESTGCDCNLEPVGTSFTVKKGYKGKIELAMLYLLYSQDGVVEATYVTNLYELIMGEYKPKQYRTIRLAYYMTKME